MSQETSRNVIWDKLFAKSHPNIDAKAPKQVRDCSYAIVRNIPKELHSKDLRLYFGGFIESGKFECFHYRHRPELQGAKTGQEASKKETCCCLVSLKTDEDREEFIEEFHKRNWNNSEGKEIAKRCFVDRLKVQGHDGEGSSSAISEADLREMIELKPPAVMPNGNIGTPSRHFHEQIRLCRLPVSVITKLGIKAQKKRKKFGAVPFEYESDTLFQKGESKYESVEDVDNEPEDPTEKIRAQQNPEDNDDGKEEDDDQCEEWERHEALHEDVTEQDRTKPKKYEEEMEVTWEKGGPGLVWYTDKNYWDEREKGTDVDWAWADDWDVDYSVYYEGKAADLGKLSHPCSRERKHRNHRWECVEKEDKYSDGDAAAEKATENLHKGVGGVMLAKMGWKPGAGLGKNGQGKVIPVAIHLEEDGKSSKERTGFGYRGEKLSRIVPKMPVKHVIASIFDTELDQESNCIEQTDEAPSGEILFRRTEDTNMKYRHIFKK